MREKIEPVMHIIDTAFAAMKAVGVEPKVRAIRGGTDGAQLSFKGLPCPNIFAGGLNFHVNDLNELSDEDRNAFMADVAKVTSAMNKAFHPAKINYGAYSDKLSHLHFHLAPKYEGGPDFGGTFVMNPGKVYLSDAEYQELIDAVKANL